jgi:hypothetical protein
MSYGSYYSDEESIYLEELEVDCGSSSSPEDCDLGESCDEEWDENVSMSSFSIYVNLSAECGISVLGEPDDELSYDSTEHEFSEVTIESEDEHLYSSLTTEIATDQIQQCCHEEAVRNSIRSAQSAQCETEQQLGPKRPSLPKSESKRSLVMAKVLGLESSVLELGQQLRKFRE